VAYLAAHADHIIDTAALKERLAQVLPDYMVPRAFAVLDSLPLNANGKVDRKALPEPVFASELAYEAPQGHFAQTVAGVWSEVLKVGQVGQHDNFFDLGGHSLLLIRAHRLLEDRLQIAIPVVNLFKYPTIESLARWIEQAPAGAASSAAAAAAGDDRALRQRAAMLQRRKATERVN
jgi:acyl carrier protein